jgi:hypothetical protein
MYTSLDNWGLALLQKSQRSRDPDERELLLNEAHEKCAQAAKLAPGVGAYNLACIHALRKQNKQAIEWLQRSHAAGKLPSKDHIAKDKDFNFIRETPEFKAWWASMGWDAETTSA